MPEMRQDFLNFHRASMMQTPDGRWAVIMERYSFDNPSLAQLFMNVAMHIDMKTTLDNIAEFNRQMQQQQQQQGNSPLPDRIVGSFNDDDMLDPTGT